VLDLFELGPPPRDLFSVDEDSVETDDAGQTKTPETRGWDAEAFNRLASVHDSSRGATDHETAQELKRYAPRQTVFVDPAASRRTRREVDALAGENKRAEKAVSTSSFYCKSVWHQS
jgi:hypothetical protein